MIVNKVTGKTRVAKDATKLGENEVVYCVTNTWRLGSTCVRHWTQRFKRLFKKGLA